MTPPADLPQAYLRFTIDAVRRDGDDLVIAYSGRLFGGVVRERLPSGVEPLIAPGAEIAVFYHQTPDGGRGPVAHLLLRDPRSGGWAELYEDWTHDAGGC